MPHRPPSAFALGQRVRVVRGDAGRTPRTGTIRTALWHFSFERYDYFLEGDHTRYAAEDLEAAE